MEQTGPTSGVADKSREGYLTAEVPPEGRGVQAPHKGPHPSVPVPGREVPITSSCKHQWGLRLRETECFYRALQAYGEELNFLASGQELEGAAFSQTEVLAEDTVPLISSPPSQSQQACAISETPSTWLALFTQPW